MAHAPAPPGHLDIPAAVTRHPADQDAAEAEPMAVRAVRRAVFAHACGHIPQRPRSAPRLCLNRPALPARRASPYGWRPGKSSNRGGQRPGAGSVTFARAGPARAAGRMGVPAARADGLTCCRRCGCTCGARCKSGASGSQQAAAQHPSCPQVRKAGGGGCVGWRLGAAGVSGQAGESSGRPRGRLYVAALPHLPVHMRRKVPMWVSWATQAPPAQ